MFSSIDLSSRALDALMLRQEMSTKNIANVDTPGYKRQDVNFENALEQELLHNKGKAIPEIYTDMTEFSYRLDGNNVDIESEVKHLSQSKVQYDTIAQRVSSEFNKYKSLLQNLK